MKTLARATTNLGRMQIDYRQTSIGLVGMSQEGQTLTALFIGEAKIPDGCRPAGSELLDEAFGQLDAWLVGEIASFSLPLAPEGTEFMRRVWRALLEIPCGQTRTYGQVAAAIGSPQAARAVGMACAGNPLPIFIPCHRVVRSDGSVGGYLGGSALKERLLGLERRNFA